MDTFKFTSVFEESLNIVLKDINRNIDRILFLDVDFAVLQSRIESRSKENNEQKRVDDTTRKNDLGRKISRTSKHADTCFH